MLIPLTIKPHEQDYGISQAANNKISSKPEQLKFSGCFLFPLLGFKTLCFTDMTIQERSN